MTRLQALKVLRAKVEAGVAQSSDPAFAFYKLTGGMEAVYKANDAYKRSLDAAKALHDEVLPGWRWEGGVNHVAGPIIWTVWDSPSVPYTADHEDPARAWLLAILAALIAQEAAE